MASKDDFSHHEWITIQAFIVFFIKLAAQLGGNLTSEIKLAGPALKERSFYAKHPLTKEILLWKGTPGEEKARSMLIQSGNYDLIVNQSIHLLKAKLSDEELDEIRSSLYYVAENISRVGLRNKPNAREKMHLAQTLFDQTLAFGIQDLQQFKKAIQIIQS